MTATALKEKISQLKKHARRFGTESVMDAAVEVGLTLEQLIELQKFVDEVDDEAARARRFHRPKKRKLTAEQRVKRLLGIEEDETNEGVE